MSEPAIIDTQNATTEAVQDVAKILAKRFSPTPNRVIAGINDGEVRS